MQQITLSEQWTGLCNQLFALVTGLIEAKRAKRTRVSVGPFSPEINSRSRVPIDKIIDLEATGQRVGVSMSSGNQAGRTNFSWYTRYNEQEFEKILAAIRFQSVFYSICEELLYNNVDLHQPLHVVHFRIENDGIKHWSRMNKMTMQAFQTMLWSQYKKAITENIPKGAQILALTYDTSNALLAELKRDYKIITLDTRAIALQRLGFNGREVCAIIDLLSGAQCSGTFVGCHNFSLKRGSTFSYVLWKRMGNAKKGVFLDLDNISAKLQIL
jgi:hypothetical protein